MYRKSRTPHVITFAQRVVYCCEGLFVGSDLIRVAAKLTGRLSSRLHGAMPASRWSARNVHAYEPHMTQSSLFLMEHTIAAMRRSFSISASMAAAAATLSPAAPTGLTCTATRRSVRVAALTVLLHSYELHFCHHALTDALNAGHGQGTAI